MRQSALRLPVLEDIRIASPCSASWDDMKGDDRVRFCGSCEKNVYNLSAMPRGDAEALLREREGEVCVRLYRRADGTVITGEDCPVGVRKKRVRRVAFGVAGAGALAAAAINALAAPVRQGAIVRSPPSQTNALADRSEAATVITRQPTAEPPERRQTRLVLADAARPPVAVMGAPVSREPPAPAVMGSAAPVNLSAAPPRPTMGRVRRPLTR